MTIIIYLLVISLILFTGMLIWFIAGNMFSDPKYHSTETPPVSVIIAIRNGEDALPKLLIDLSLQDYTGELEFILVDDQSEDSTKQLIEEMSTKDKRFKYESSVNGGSSLNYKKRALDAGIQKARSEWLLFSDVDCRMKSTWVRGMTTYFTDDVDYVIGFSEIDQGDTLVTRFQSLDYLMLMIAARGTTNSGKAWASSGQNQAYRKSLFNKVSGYSQIADEIQGDDSLFLQVCRKQNPTKIVFADNTECRTKARQEISWVTLFKQRVRWAGDTKIMWKFNQPFFLFILATFILSLLLIVTFTVGIFHDMYFITVSVKFFIIHFILEFILFFIGVRQLAISTQFIDFCFWYLIHIPYVVMMGMGSLFIGQLSWRGRKIYPI